MGLIRMGTVRVNQNTPLVKAEPALLGYGVPRCFHHNCPKPGRCIRVAEGEGVSFWCEEHRKGMVTSGKSPNH